MIPGEIVTDAHERMIRELQRRVRHIEKQLDTLGTPLLKRLWFRIDGWPAWWIVAESRARRFWHR